VRIRFISVLLLALLALLAGSCRDATVVQENPRLPELPKGDRHRWSVLVDTAHGQLDGTPRWRIDDDSPEPQPADPPAPEDWNGALSSMAWALSKTGAFRFVQTPPGSQFVYESCPDRTAWAHDLACHDLVILAEPNTPFDAAEVAALRAFVAAGGGLLMAANHYGSNREGVPCDGDGRPAPVGPSGDRRTAGDEVDSTRVLMALEAFTGLRPAAGDPSPCIGGDPSRTGLNANFIERERRLPERPGDPILNGPFGAVRLLSFEHSTSFSEAPQHEAAEVHEVILRRSPQGAAAAMVVGRSRYGRGRTVALGDVSLMGDGSAEGEQGPCRFRNPARVEEDADRLVLNALA
jgi:hypothetical protein